MTVDSSFQLLEYATLELRYALSEARSLGNARCLRSYRVELD
ncbi:hypothetical protein MIPYR_30344 [uncultured Microbacterium sp.]|uniref:Uncharacterized protein n=1 Tax=uncultured Microbacterium sp. TaxID=191216 RepID=A0A1Y5PAR5_9MICO|nr:hypothetical protein MIPYR_30344 [uncultured Microbacterium sp.]